MLWKRLTYTFIATTNNRNATVMESPRQGAEAWLTVYLPSALKPPARAINTTATTHTMTASVSSQPSRSCHAGRVKRKKFSGRPKMGSLMLPDA